MKKLIIALLSLTLLFALSACNASKGTNGVANGGQTSSQDNLQTSSLLQSSDTNQRNTTSAKINSDEAKSIALKDAGLNEADVNFLRSELDLDDGLLKYEVEFNSNGVEYEYDINADTGEILWVDKDYD